MLIGLRTGNFGALFSLGIEPNPEPPPAARKLRRQAALREPFEIGAQRLLRVAARLARPRRLVGLPALLARVMRSHSSRRTDLPDPSAALPRADGFAGLARDLNPAAMMEGYGKGLAPSAELGPVAWHSRARRLVAAPAALAREARGSDPNEAVGWSVSFDRDIDGILARSGRARSGPIMPEPLLYAFAELFEAGFVHGFCLRDERGRLIAGGFGVAIGGVFILEGAFETKSGAAAFGLRRLSERLAERRFALVECAPAAARLCGDAFRSVAREDFLVELARHMSEENVGRWRSEPRPGREPAEPRRLAA